LKEEVIEKDEVSNKNLVRQNKRKKEQEDYLNYYTKIDEKIVDLVEMYGFPKGFAIKCLKENINNHCTASYYLLCIDQNY